jgi:hypothetical protein
VRIFSRVHPLVGVAAVVGALLAEPASAKVWFQDMGGRHLRQGQRVASVIMGCPGNPSCRDAVEGARIYLRSVPRAGHAVRLGRVSANGRVWFRVPRVARGRYRLVARVRLAAGWRTIVASDPFWIRSRP